MTCAHCGADAVDASGVCQACGWRAASASSVRHESTDSLAETREADIPLPARRAPALRTGAPAPGNDLPGPAAARNAPRSGPRTGGYAGGTPATKRYCGTCGAEIEPGQQFCGQCGTAVAGFEEPLAHPTRAARGTYPGAYDAADAWSPADEDAPTEEFTPDFGFPVPAHQQSGVYGSGVYGAATGARTGLSREMRVFLGILCILGALISGAGAIALAFLR